MKGDDKDIDDSTAPLIEHLAELRTRLINSLVAFCVAMVAAFASRRDVAAFVGGARFIDGPPALRAPLAAAYLGAYGAIATATLGHQAMRRVISRGMPTPANCSTSAARCTA